jgi:methionyl-tRNA formyltransferase
MLSRLVVLAAFNARSQAYLQAMAAQRIAPATVLTYGAPRHVAGEPHTGGACNAVALPDLSESIPQTCTRAGWPVRHCDEASIDSPILHGALARCSPSLVVFSGYAGQIVGARLLQDSAPFLHVHSGGLPAYRGSTTIYYSILQDRLCAATAFFLRPGVDRGPIIAQRLYPLPLRGMDVDRIYDNAIRAHLLVEALAILAQRGPAGAHDQAEDAAHTYFVIHPVLKHIALLSLPAAQECVSARIEGDEDAA